ncbi:MAG TPA: hypothetical protein VF773_13705 [Verrucomicrobiae bacterium]
MLQRLLLFISVLVMLTSFSIAQQRGGGMGGPAQPKFSQSFIKLFGENKAFSADALIEVKMQESDISMPAKMAFLDGKTRLEMDTTKMKGAALPPQALEQMKQMGMAEMVTISRPDKKESYLVYPGLKSYAATPDQQAATPAASEAEPKKTEIGKEKIDGKDTTKYKVVMKDDQGKDQEATVWIASDLKNFPVRIQTVNDGVPSTITFSNVKLEKPDASSFEPPTDFQRYNDMGAMVREQMMKRMAPPAGVPAPQP